jgi:hypothetical protein
MARSNPSRSTASASVIARTNPRRSGQTIRREGVQVRTEEPLVYRLPQHRERREWCGDERETVEQIEGNYRGEKHPDQNVPDAQDDREAPSGGETHTGQGQPRENDDRVQTTTESSNGPCVTETA